MRERQGISSLKGVGEKTEKLFHHLGIQTIGDLIRYYPRGFEIFDDPIPVSQVEEGKVCAVAGSVFGRIQVSGSNRVQVTTLYLKDLTGTLKVIWFRMPFLRNTLSKGGLLILRGRVVRRRDSLVMEHPEIYYPAVKYEEKLHTMQPVYHLTAGLTNNTVIKAVRQALDCAEKKMDILPADLSGKYHFPPYEEAARNMHFPENKEGFAAARERFVFEEFLVFILSLQRMKESGNRAENRFHLSDQEKIRQFLDALPYRLTGAQMKVWNKIRYAGAPCDVPACPGGRGIRKDDRGISGASAGRTEWIPGSAHGAHGSAGAPAL